MKILTASFLLMAIVMLNICEADSIIPHEKIKYYSEVPSAYELAKTLFPQPSKSMENKSRNNEADSNVIAFHINFAFDSAN